MMADGTPLPALAGSDAATALDAALGYAGPYRTFPVTGDVSGAAIDQSVTAQVLDWQPRPAPPVSAVTARLLHLSSSTFSLSR